MTFDNGRELHDYVHVWITSGREIENYVPKEIFDKILVSEPYLRKYMYISGEAGQRQRKDVKMVIEDKHFDPFAAFDFFYAEKYKFVDDSPLSDDQVTNIATDLSKKKASIAKSVVAEWKIEHYYSDDLKRNIANLIEHIKKANFYGEI
ncbi:hypothetical protein [Brevibacillus nitrificans]|uniref:hypothetical protein n=1 Tax=Brevibacillus nitrificans TaxID=651560 RepID=UPI002624A41D|nr:hypothetical protein [Brevibacillus nitrificans]